MIVNSGFQSTDYFFILENLNITAVYSDVLSKSSSTRSPNMKTRQAFGYDSNNVIQLATMTLRRGEKELGGVVTLGEPTTYATVISRSLFNTSSPFTYEDRFYGSKQ